jgi:hypothetical protein
MDDHTVSGYGALRVGGTLACWNHPFEVARIEAGGLLSTSTRPTLDDHLSTPASSSARLYEDFIENKHSTDVEWPPLLLRLLFCPPV